MRRVFTLLICVFSLSCFSQNEGFLTLEQDQRIEQLIQKQREIHANDSTIDGFRIQIFMESGNDAVEKANAAMAEFQLKYPDIPIYLVFGQPYYRLRVGDFRTRLEAEKAHRLLVKEYKKAFVTSDRIQLPYNIFCDPNVIMEEEKTVENDTIEDGLNDTIDMEIYYYEE